MNKAEFLMLLNNKISNLPKADIQKWLDYYSEMIDDRIEDGMSEEEAVSELGTPEKIAEDIFAATPIAQIVKANVKPNRTLSVWEIILLILGFPLWFPLLITVFAVIMSVYIVIWSLILVLYAVNLTFAATAIAGIFGSISFILGANFPAMFVFLGTGFFFVGLTILMFFVANFTAKGLILLTKKILISIKNCFIKRSDVK